MEVFRAEEDDDGVGVPALDAIEIDGCNDAVVRDDDASAFRRSRLFVFAAQLFAEFSQWLWTFGSVTWLASLAGSSDSLFLNSSYQATQELATCLLVPRVARFATGHGTAFDRKSFATFVLLAQLPCVSIAALAFARELRDVENNERGEEDGAAYDADPESNAERSDSWALSLALIYIFGTITQVLQQGYLVSIQRDWSVVVSNGDEKVVARTNVIMKQIHLACIITGPTVAGFAAEHGGGVLAIGTVKLTAILIQSCCIARAHALLPRITDPPWDRPEHNEEGLDDAAIIVQDCDATATQNNTCSYVEDMRVYFNQKMKWAGIAFALLYTNVLCFGGMMTAYLHIACGMSWHTIGLWQGASNFIGLVGTCVFACLHKFFSVQTTGLQGLIWQFCFISVSMIGILWTKENPHMTAVLMIAGVVPSRIGLWVNDLSTIQLFQMTVPTSQRGRVGGTQTSISSLFEFLPLILGMIYHETSDYLIVISIGYAFVGLAVFTYVVGVWLPYFKGENVRFKTVVSNEENDDNEEKHDLS